MIADNGSGKTAQASVSLTGTASLKKQFKTIKTQKRIRIYGIHFDVDSAHIQPRSEPVIADIAQIMHDTAGLRFQEEGHTDSDGGAAYNMRLSQRRARSCFGSEDGAEGRSTRLPAVSRAILAGSASQ